MKIVDTTIETKIYEIRDKKVMLDSDLAKLYQVETKVLNQAVKRNIKRFPNDFMFQLSKKEFDDLRSQFVTANFSMTRTIPFVFTEHGIAMLSSVLKSNISIEINIQIMRTFTKIREFSSNYKDIIFKLKEMEDTMRLNQEQTDENKKHIKIAFDLLSQIVEDTDITQKN